MPGEPEASAATVSSAVQVLDVWQVEADHVGCVAGIAGVGKKADAFAGTDSPEALGDDVGVAEGVDGAGLVVADEVGSHPPFGPAARRLTVDDAPEPLRSAKPAHSAVAALRLGNIRSAAHHVTHPLRSGTRPRCSRPAAGKSPWTRPAPPGRGCRTTHRRSRPRSGPPARWRSIPTRSRPSPAPQTARHSPDARQPAQAAPPAAARGRVLPATPHRRSADGRSRSRRS